MKRRWKKITAVLSASAIVFSLSAGTPFVYGAEPQELEFFQDEAGFVVEEAEEGETEETFTEENRTEQSSESVMQDHSPEVPLQEASVESEEVFFEDAETAEAIIAGDDEDQRWVLDFVAETLTVRDGNVITKEALWYPYRDRIKSLIIIGDITRIEDGVFQDYKNLETVETGNVEVLGDSVFQGCTRLRSVSIPNVKRVGKSAFEECSNLFNLEISSSLIEIGSRAFWGCRYLECPVLPRGLLSIGEYAFGYYGYYEKIAGFTIRSYRNDAASAYAAANGFSYIQETQYVATPTLLKLENVDGGVKLNWTEIEGAEKYQILRKSDNSDWMPAVVGSGSSCIDYTAASGTNYTYTVCCISADEKEIISDYDKTGKTIFYVAAPEVPVLTNTLTGIRLSWPKVEGAELYRVFRKTGNGGWKALGDVTATSCTDKKVESGVTYTYSVRCISADKTKYTSGYNGKGSIATYLSAPVLSGLTLGTTGVSVSWNKVPGAEYYRVFRKTGTEGWKAVKTTSGTTCADKTVQSGTTYTYAVRCISADAKTYTSAYYAEGKTIKYLEAPSLPILGIQSTGIKITWNKVTGAEKYRVFRRTTTEGWKKVADTTSLTYTDTTAKNGTLYAYAIRCISADGKTYTSAYYSSGTRFYYLSRPQITNAAADSDHSINIQWERNAAADGYEVYYKYGSEIQTESITRGETTEVLLSGLKAGETYSVYLRSLKQADGKIYYSAWSSGKNITVN